MSDTGFDFSKAANNRNSQAHTLHGVTVEIKDVEHKSSARCTVRGIMVSLDKTGPGNTAQDLALVGRTVHIDSFFSKPKLLGVNEVKFAEVNLENVKTMPLIGKQGDLTLNRVTILTEQMFENSGVTSIHGKLYYIDPRCNGPAALMTEDMKIQITTHVPKRLIQENAPLFLEKLVLQNGGLSDTLCGRDPRLGAHIPGHPDFTI